MNILTVLATLVLSGLLGAVGQGIRAATGMKGVSAADWRKQFDAFSLMIGAISGVLAGIVVLQQGEPALDHISVKTLLAWIAAGYAGVDFIENAFSNMLPKLGRQKTGSSTARATDAGGGNAKMPETPATPATPADIPDVTALSTKVDAMSNQVGELHNTLTHLMASGDGGVPGTNYPAWALQRDTTLARTHYWSFIAEGAGAYDLPICVVLAIGSKESQWGLALKPPGPDGAGDFTPRNPAKWGTAMPKDRKGWGRGLMQIDWYSNEFAKTGDWQDARENILHGCELLAGKIRKFSDAGKDAETALRCGVSAYNGMSGAASPYANDVMARSAWIEAQGLDGAPQATAA